MKRLEIVKKVKKSTIQFTELILYTYIQKIPVIFGIGDEAMGQNLNSNMEHVVSVSVA